MSSLLNGVTQRYADAWRKVSCYLWAVVLLIIVVGFTALFATLLIDQRTQDWKRAGIAVSNLDASARRDILRSFENADQALLSVREMMRADPDFRFDQQKRLALLGGSVTKAALGEIDILDATGKIVLSSNPTLHKGMNFANEAFFFTHASTQSDSVFTAKTVTRLPLEEVVVISRKLTDDNGLFSGVAIFSLRLSNLLPLFQSLDLGEKGAISLFATDGTLLLRAPEFAGSVGKNYVTTSMFWQIATTSGLFTTVSAIDHVDRLVSASHVEKLPLIVTVGLSVEEIYASWNRLALITILAFALLAAGVVGLSIMLSLELRRQRENEQLYRTLAHVDGLTGLYNRRRFDMVLESEFARAQQQKTALSVIMLDVDRFKFFNDLYGHQAGDECLKRIAGAIAIRPRRETDIAARYGGEEISIILPETDANGAEIVAEQVRVAIEDLRIIHTQSHTGYVTASLGCATYDLSSALSPMTPAELVAAADQALYGAKRSGRNRVVSHTMLQCGIPALAPANESVRTGRVEEVMARLTNESGSSFDRVSRMAAQAFGTSMAFVTLVETARQSFVGKEGLSGEPISRENSFCAHALDSPDVLVILDASRDIRFSGNALVTGEPYIRFYAGAPLIDDKTGTTFGSMCIADQAPRTTFSDDQRELLLGFAALAVEQLSAVLLNPESPQDEQRASA